MRRVDYIGRRFSRLTVVAVGARPRTLSCVCDCGHLREVYVYNLTAGASRSCGCLQRERSSVSCRERSTVHGHAARDKSPEYIAWRAMISRCENPRHRSFAAYGGRGIRVCSRWRASFSRFLEDVGRKPKGRTLGRVDNNGNYEKSNVRWETSREQQRNRRSNLRLTVNGRTATASDWADETGLSVFLICSRIQQGWPHERAVTEPKRKYA